MVKVKVVLQNNSKEYTTEMEEFDPMALAQEIKSDGEALIAIGKLLVNKHHIEIAYEIED